MGGKLPLDRFPHPAGRRWHCTEWEIDQALQSHQQGSVRKVWIYLDVTDFPARTVGHSKAEWDEIDARHRAVADYFDTLNPDPDPDPDPDPETQRHSVSTYQGVPDLQRLIGPVLREWVTRQLDAQAGQAPAPAQASPDSRQRRSVVLFVHRTPRLPMTGGLCPAVRLVHRSEYFPIQV